MRPRLSRSTPQALLAVTTILTGIAAPLAVEAQELVPPAPRQGYYMGFTLGGAVNVNASVDDEIDPLTGPLFVGRIGEMVTDWIGFGLLVGGGFGQGGSWESGFGGLMLETQLVPPVLPHLAARIGVGAGGISLTDTEAVDQDVLKGTGGAYYAFGVSYDLFPFYDRGSGGLGVVPSAQVHYMPGELVEAWFFVAGLEIAWWTGLDRDKLDLPFEEQYRRDEE